MPAFRSRLLASASLVIGALCTALGPTVASANPQGGQVVAGQATISTAPSTVQIEQQSQRAIIDWQAFSIGADEQTVFVQPNADAIALNRVTGGDPSAILGRLTANGQVWLINPNGIAFGESARVDVAGLLATTLDIDNNDFLSGNFRFRATGANAGSVTNAGQITARDAGLVGLVAPSVANSGVIAARLGHIQLASASGFTLDLYGDGKLAFLLDGQTPELPELAEGVAVANSGSLIADGGTVFLTANAAKGVVDQAINMSGYVQARSVGAANGIVTLDGGAQGDVVVAGTIDASGVNPGETGGSVSVTGATVALENSARIDASGAAGGGKVLIGGDYQGGGELRNAARTTIAEGAVITADAVETGDGGRVIIWSDDTTTFLGRITAQGGAASGDGGFAEVSGGHVLAFQGSVDLRAANGSVGSLLLDPENVTIAAAGDAPQLPDTALDELVLAATMDNSILAVSPLETALAQANVTVTTSGGTGEQAGDIVVATNVSWSSDNALTLSADRNIVIDDDVTIANTGAGDLKLQADAGGMGVGNVTFSGTGGVDFSQSAGAVLIYYNPAGGYGSPTDYSPYVMINPTIPEQLTAFMLINSLEALQGINNHLSSNFALSRDIDASATAEQPFTPIGGNAPAGHLKPMFTGSFDGQGHTISGLTIWSDYGSVGLFDTTNGSIIKNLNLADASVTGTAYANHVGIIAGVNNGIIENVTTSGTVTAGPAFVGEHAATLSSVGGIAGSNLGLITASRSSATVVGGDNNLAGGLVGGNSGAVDHSSASGTVSGTIVGGLAGTNLGNIDNTFASGPVTASAGTVANPYAGGLAGEQLSTSATISNSYATGPVAVTGTVRFGGGAAGLVALNYGSISATHAVGSVTSTNDSGGLVSETRAGSITDSYWDTSTTGQAISAGGTGLTTSQLKGALPSGLDASVWAVASSVNDGYPYLKWQTENAPTTTIVSFGDGSSPAPPPSPPTPPATDMNVAALLASLEHQALQLQLQVALLAANEQTGALSDDSQVLAGIDTFAIQGETQSSGYMSELLNRLNSSQTIPTVAELVSAFQFLLQLNSLSEIADPALRATLSEHLIGGFSGAALLSAEIAILLDGLERRGVIDAETRPLAEAALLTAKNIAMLDLKGQLVDQTLLVTNAWSEFLRTQTATSDAFISAGQTAVNLLLVSSATRTQAESDILRAAAIELMEAQAAIADSGGAGWLAPDTSIQWDVVSALVEIRLKQESGDASALSDIAALKNRTRSADAGDFPFFFRYSTFASDAAAKLGISGW